MFDPLFATAIEPVIVRGFAASWLEAALPADELHRLGWVVVHSLWQVAAVAAVLAAILRILPRRSSADAQARYVVAGLALLALPAACLVTYAVIPRAQRAETSEVVAVRPSTVAPQAGVPVAVGHASAAAGRGGFSAPLAVVGVLLRRAVIMVEPWLAWCAAVWLAGFLAAAIRLGVGLSATRRLVAEAVVPADPRWQARLRRWQDALGITGRIRVLSSRRVDVPMVVGWLEPVVIWPLAAVTGMPPDQVDAILAHELAHIRRHDLFLNLLQSVIETLFFHHPAAWWISSQVRAEREHCADDLAVRVLAAGRAGSRLSYARALVALEERRHGTTLAVASAGGSLVERVRRLTDTEAGPRRPVRPAASLLVGLFLIAVVAPFVVVGGPPSDGLPEDTNQIGSLSPTQATRLLADFKAVNLPVDIPGISNARLAGLSLKGVRSIDAETARALAGFRGELLVLDGLTSLSADSAGALAAFVGTGPSKGNATVAVISLDGLAELSADTAASLAGFKGMHLSLDGLTTLSPETAASVAGFQVQYLSFGGIRTLSPEAAAGLARFKGRVLALPGLTSLPVEAARELARSTAWDASLPRFTTLPVDVAEAIAESPQNWMRFGGLAELSGEAAAALGRGKPRILEFKALRTLSAEAARGLAGYAGGHLMLNGLTTLTPEAAAGLSGSRCPHIFLNGLTTISPEAARELAGFKGISLSLHGMTSLTPEAAAELVRSPAWDGYLGRITDLPVDLARAVAKSRSRTLCLNGLKAVTPEAAAALASFEGQELQLNGLASLSEADAVALATFRGGLSLQNVPSLSDAAARVLATSELKWLHIYQVTSRLSQEKKLTPELAMLAAAISRTGGGISLDGITAIDSPDSVAIATILASAKGRLSIPHLRKLSPRTLSALATKENIEIPFISALELIAEPDGSPTDDIVIPDGFEEMQQRRATTQPRRR